MNMVCSDMHAHSTWSPDGRSALSDMVAAAKKRGLRYFGISEHFDVDKISRTLYGETTDPAYFDAARALQEAGNTETFTFLAGAEFGYSDEPAAIETLLAIEEKYRPDFVVNSVHVVDGADCWFAEYFEGKTKERAYARYLERVIESLKAPYSYDVVGHVGYCSRNAAYPDRKLRYEDFPDLFDELLRGVAARGKLLEANSSSRGAGSDFLPDTDVFARYYELGGRLVSFGSDAHETGRIAEKYEKLSALKEIGFSEISVPCRGKLIKIPL